MKARQGKAKGAKPTTPTSRNRMKSSARFLSVTDVEDHTPKPLESDCCSICGFAANSKSKAGGELKFHKCFASICLPCMQHAMDQQYACGITDIFCPICLTVFSLHDLAVIHPRLNNEIAEKITLSELTNVVQCRFCPNKFTFEPSDPKEAAKEQWSQGLTPAQIECAAKNRMLCNECHISMCTECGAVPFHVGETCEEHKWYVEGYICRICGHAANPSSAEQIALLTCGKPECVKLAEEMCDHVHPCGHACVGVKGETVHPECPECSIGGSLCPKCDHELWGSPCLRLDCGHTIHRDCALKIIRRGFSGPVLKLPLCPAPGCGEFVRHRELQAREPENYQKWMNMEKDSIDVLARRRVAAEGLEYHAEVVSKSSPFSAAGPKAPLYWAKKNLRFMICTQHMPPTVYTLGRVGDPATDFTTTCPDCRDYRFPVCPKHPVSFMQYKCENCCSVGVRLSHRQETDRGTDLVWLCDICHDMPGRNQTRRVCKGNCRFAPHQATGGCYYGRCTYGDCGDIVRKPRHIPRGK